MQDKIVIAKMDLTLNDLPASAPFAVQGFPTVKLFKSQTNQIVDFTGARDLETLSKFILDNANNKVTLGHQDL